MELETIRQSFSGQQPSEAEDWNDMSRTMKLLLRNLSFEIMNDALNAQGYEVHNQKLKDNPKRLSNEVFAE